MGPAPQLTFEPPLLARLEAAVADADRRGHHAVTTEHLVLALSREPSAQAILAGCGVDVPELERELDEYLDLVIERKGRPRIDETYWRLLERAGIHAQSAGRAQIVIADVLASLVRAPEAYAAMLLGAAGVEPVDLLRSISHGRCDVRPVAAAGSPVLIVRLHNDDYTPMDFVVGVLTDVMELDEETAKRRMLEVHGGGSADVARLPAPEAIERAMRVYECASEAGHPLRVTLEPA